VEWRRPITAVAVLGLGVLFVVTGLVVGSLVIVWAMLALVALVVGLVLLAGDSGPEWPDFPTWEHSPYDDGPAEALNGAGGASNGASNGVSNGAAKVASGDMTPWNAPHPPAPSERRSPAH